MERLASCRDQRALEPLLALTKINTHRATIEAVGELGGARAAERLREIAGSLVGQSGPLDGFRSLLAEAREDDYAGELRSLVTLAIALAKLGDHSLGDVVIALTELDRGAADGLREAYLVRGEAVEALGVVMVD